MHMLLINFYRGCISCNAVMTVKTVTKICQLAESLSFIKCFVLPFLLKGGDIEYLLITKIFNDRTLESDIDRYTQREAFTQFFPPGYLIVSI